MTYWFTVFIKKNHSLVSRWMEISANGHFAYYSLCVKILYLLSIFSSLCLLLGLPASLPSTCRPPMLPLTCMASTLCPPAGRPAQLSMATRSVRKPALPLSSGGCTHLFISGKKWVNEERPAAPWNGPLATRICSPSTWGSRVPLCYLLSWVIPLGGLNPALRLWMARNFS